MSWTKQIDRKKFPRRGMVVGSWDADSRKWRIAMFPEKDTDCEPTGFGEGADPMEAMLNLCVGLGALADTGEWTAVADRDDGVRD